MADSETKKESGASGGALAYTNIGKELMKLGEVQLAMKTCERGLARFAKSAPILVFRGEIYVALFNRDKKPEFAKAALSSFSEALKLDPKNYLAKLISAQLFLKGGARKKAKALVSAILETDPSDDRAKALLEVIKKMELAAGEGAKEEKKESAKPAEPEEVEELVVDENLVADSKAEEVVIASSMDEDEEEMQQMLASKVNILSRIDGLLGIFLIDSNGQPFKVINKAKLDVNVIPSMVFNLFKSSSNGIHRCGLGSFQRGTLVSPIGTFIMANAFYATLGVVVDNDSDMAKVEKRIGRYLKEVTE